MASNLTPWLPGMLFGAGVNSLNGEIRGDAVVRTQVEPPLETQSQSVHLFMKRIDSLEELTQSLNISVEAEGRYGLVSGSARFDYTKSSKMTEYNVYFLIKVTVTNGFQRMRDVTLKDGARALLEHGDFSRFREANGDCFVLGMQTGGELFALLEFKTRSEAEKESVAMGLQLSFNALISSASLSVAISEQMARSKTQTSVEYHLFVDPPLPGKPLPFKPDIDKIIEYAADFPTAVATRGAPFAVLLQDYRTLDLPKPPNFVDLEAQRDNLIRMLRDRNQDLVNLDKVDFILDNQGQFEGLSPQKVVELTDTRNVLAARINQITRQASLCADNAEKCDLPANLPAVSLVDLPARKREFAEDPIEIKAENLPPGVREWFLTRGDSRRVGSWRIQEFKDFTGAAIYHNTAASDQTFEVHGDIYLRYIKEQVETGPLGLPTSDELLFQGDGRVSNFQNGRITWARATRETSVEMNVARDLPGLAKIEANIGKKFGF